LVVRYERHALTFLGYRITQAAVDKFIRDRMGKLKDQG